MISQSLGMASVSMQASGGGAGAALISPTELQTVSERLTLHCNDLDRSLARLEALRSRLVGDSELVGGNADFSPPRMGIVGAIQSNLDWAAHLSVKIDELIGHLERVG